jgi:hypothetical protein
MMREYDVDARNTSNTVRYPPCWRIQWRAPLFVQEKAIILIKSPYVNLSESLRLSYHANAT